MRQRSRTHPIAWRAGVLALTAAAWPALSRAQTSPPTEVRYPVRDSLSIVADVHRGSGGAGGATILLFHQGGGSARGEYRNITPRLLRGGYNVVASSPAISSR
jgi:hypothetical protein